MSSDPLHEIERLDDVEVHRHASLAPLTTFRIGGPADLLVIPRTGAALARVVQSVRRLGVELLVIGAGSDLLITDAGIRGVVLKVPSGLEPVRIDGDRLYADAGRTLPDLMRQARRAGLAGLEFAGGIPGSLGGSLAVNAGAWGREMADVADRLIGIDEGGEPVEVRGADVEWSYRHAGLPAPMVITEAVLRLEPDAPERIAEREEKRHAARRRTQPLGEPSAGCVFRNPLGKHAGELIEAAGLKGERVGGALVSPVHANFIVNSGGATASEVMRLIARVRERVERTAGVQLELEIKLVGLSTEVEACEPPSVG